MRIDIAEATEVLWLDEHHELSLTELVTLSGLSSTELQHLIDCEAISPLAAAQPALVEPAAEADLAHARFSAQCLALARTASRLRSDFDLDLNGLALTLRLLSRVHELETELRHLRAQRPH
jgi:chaperone modulatory protein CbpM